MARNGFAARGGWWVLAQLPLMLLAAVIPVWTGAGRLVPDHPLSYAGVAMVVAGVALVGWGSVNLGEALTSFPRPLDQATLRRQGAYRWMRHPIYTGVLLAALGWALWWLSAAGALYAPLYALFFDRKAAHEEAWLREKYPDYGEYARRVKKFIPGVY